MGDPELDSGCPNKRRRGFMIPPDKGSAGRTQLGLIFIVAHAVFLEQVSWLYQIFGGRSPRKRRHGWPSSRAWRILPPAGRRCFKSRSKGTRMKAEKKPPRRSRVAARPAGTAASSTFARIAGQLSAQPSRST